MAGEYVRWLARDVKPREKKELTPEEKRRNWWDYHKWHVVIVLVLLVLLGDLVYDVIRDKRNQPDYVIAYVGQTALPDTLAEAVQTGICALGEDINGNGKVQVEVRQYILSAEEDFYSMIVTGDSERGQTASILLQTNIEMVESMVFLLEDPELFQAGYPILCRADGSYIEDTPDSDVPVCYRWADCPALAGLELGTFTVPVIDGQAEGDCQKAMENLMVARRGLWDDGTNEAIRGAIALWERMTEGAK